MSYYPAPGKKLQNSEEIISWATNCYGLELKDNSEDETEKQAHTESLHGKRQSQLTQKSRKEIRQREYWPAAINKGTAGAEQASDGNIGGRDEDRKMSFY